LIHGNNQFSFLRTKLPGPLLYILYNHYLYLLNRRTVRLKKT